MGQTVGDRIKYLRAIFGLQQEEFAAELYVQRGYIAQIEAGKQPSDALIALISAKYDISSDWLHTGVGPIRNDLNLRIKKEKASYALETGFGLETIGQRIRFARLYREIPASQLNSMLSTSDRYLSAIEMGKKDPTKHDIEVIARNVAASEDWILTGTGPIYFMEKGGIFSPIAESSLNSFKGSEEVQDKELNEIIDGIKRFWEYSSKDVRAWFKVQFKRTFPEIEEKTGLYAAEEKKGYKE